MKERMKSAKFWLCIALAMCLISMIGAEIIQTDGGNVSIESLKWVDSYGNTVAANLYVPSTATEDNPAPAVIAVHGWWNNKEMQDPFAIELARRGYVVLCPEMYGHGDSERLTWDELYENACGENAAVEYIATLPFVDTSRIGLTGHSSGGDEAGAAVAMDNERETHLISAVLFQASYLWDDAGGDHRGDLLERDAGILQSMYDEFFYTTYNEDGTTNPPREFLTSNDSKIFLNFNEEGFEGTPVSGEYYTKEIDGEESFRVVYALNMTHAPVCFSKTGVKYAIEFFDKALGGAPIQIDSSNQVWHVKELFNALGLLGLFMFFAAFPCVMVEGKYFGSLKAKGDVLAAPAPKDKKAKLWFWIPLAIGAVFSYISFYYIIGKMTTKQTPYAFFPETPTLAIGLWATSCGVLSAIMMFAYYKKVGKPAGFSLKDSGIAIGWKNFGKTVLLAILTMVAAFNILYFADMFFQTDFRYYIVTLRTFDRDMALEIFHYLPLFLIFYVINSVSINCFNFNRLANKEWVNIVVVAFFNALGMIAYEAVQYGVAFSTGYLAYRKTLGEMISGIWAVPAIFYLLVTPFITRGVYKKTKNPYLAGLINGTIVCIITAAQSASILGG